MPHKHKRPRDGNSERYDLPPTEIARPLPVTISLKTKAHHNARSQRNQSRERKRQQDNDADDVPRDFKRLMSFWQGVKSLDRTAAKERSRSENSKARNEDPKMLSELTAHSKAPSKTTQEQVVTAQSESLPENDSKASAQTTALLRNSKASKTRLEKKLNKMQDRWRQEEVKRKAKLEQAQAEAELDDEYAHLWAFVSSSRKRSKLDDPWAKVAAERHGAEPVNAGLRGLHDVVQAPPRDLLKTRVKRS